MLEYKHKVLFSLISRDNDDELKECIESILAQTGIIPFISIACLNSNDTSFFIAKSFCKDILEYEPFYIVSKNIAVYRVNTEKKAIDNAIKFGNNNKCEYYTFMHNPGILNKDYTKRAIKLIKEDVIGVYTDSIDSSIKMYSNLASDREINLGPYFVTKGSIANMFNHEAMADYLKNIVNRGVFAHIPEFLVESKWIKSVLKREMVMSRLA